MVIKPKGILYLVATPIGNLEDITFRAVRILGEVTVIAAEDTRRSAKLLRHYQIRTRTISLHEHNERRQTSKLIGMLEDNLSIALISDAGTPLLSDPGGYLVREALERSIPVQSIPGPSAILAAVVASGLTEGHFTFAGFPPSRSKARTQWFQSLLKDNRPLVFFESPHRILRSLADMLAVFGDRQVAVCREMTKLHEELVKGPISFVMKQITAPKGEFTVVLAPPIETMPTVPEGEIVKEFGRMTNLVDTRRDAVVAIARMYGLTPRAVYQVIEGEKRK